ncbi:uncharacterized protein VP01_3354g1 [Puccinia sorghi]|uniref:Uncharacterized protein n=1 Tax=Puccinia sorghi TaxID=27349 RepID=A0A0L6UYW6_9BASI|nr:uncharacterized protein VP01_3354g1 [Puccinia sorghi]
MQNILQYQNDVIAELTANRTTYPTTASNPFADDVKHQFLKSPLKFYKEVNPQKPILSFDGSNYVEWEITVHRALQHAFVLKKTFLNKETDRFLGLDLLENKAVAALMRSTLDDALLSIVESQELSSSKELFNLNVNDLAEDTKSYLLKKCSALPLTTFLQANHGLQDSDPSCLIQPLDNMTTTPTFGQVTTIIQSALSKVSKGPTSILSPGTIPSDVEMSVNAINGCRNDRYKPPHRRSNEQSQHHHPITMKKDHGISRRLASPLLKCNQLPSPAINLTAAVELI